MQALKLSSKKRTEFIDITDELQAAVTKQEIKSGILFLYVPHTTAGLTVNENADPDVKRDMMVKMAEIVPENSGYKHAEGNSDSHIKSSLFGNELFVFIEDGIIKKGTWQGIYFTEFDGPRNREVWFKISKD